MAGYSNVRDYFEGKVGSLVYSSWRGKKYVKVFVPPSDPHTPDQMGVRTVFKMLAHIGKALYEPILKEYTLPKPVKETAYNHFIHINHELFQDKIWDPAKLKIFEGSLYNPGIENVNYYRNTKNLDIEWETDVVPGAEDDDDVIVVVMQNGEVITYSYEKRNTYASIHLENFLWKLKPGQIDVYIAFIQMPKMKHEVGIVSATAYKSINISVFREEEVIVEEGKKEVKSEENTGEIKKE